jgi:ATP-dependent helicase/nuclease subunit B
VLAEQRQVGGALRLFCGRNNEQGDVLRPSRLLFLCEDEALPDRVAWLFPQQTEGEGNDIEPARTVAWKLRPHMRVPEVKRISPSRLRAYLECPFRYYLSHELRMESVQPGKRELAAPEFGNLVHAAFQQLAADTRAKESADAEKIADCLIDAALSQARQLYGSKPAPLIALQLESVKQRLRHAAEAEAAERAQGWRIYLAEWSPEEASSLEIAGARLNCKVDRVDRHESSGRIRVLDFKTSDSATSPRDAHVDSVTSRRVLADEDVWKTFHLSTGERWQWLDLQLPLYAAALQREGLRVDEVGYFALPKSVQETKVLMWEDFNEEWVEHALVCAGEVVERLRAGRFWPPAAKAHSRDYDELFLGDLEAAVEMPLPSA